ncbi:acyl-CoA carboxylase subunit epsilon [Streptomyces sp. NPDC091209]|uniref:acyl-CoA carboxylase subunit epsilon n=1 Tax=Streptomyces sp. NPDC091209 TaxID=3365974 RepID=UPI00380863D3
MSGAASGASREDVIRVLRGDPDPAEVAAVTAVLLELVRARAESAGKPVRGARPEAAGWDRPADGAPHRIAASWRTTPRH